MFEPWVRELYVRTLGVGVGTLCSNSGFGNSGFEPQVEPKFQEFEPRVQPQVLMLCSARLVPTRPGVRTLGSGTLQKPMLSGVDTTQQQNATTARMRERLQSGTA